MEVENSILSKVTQSQKDMPGMYSLLGGYQQKSTEYTMLYHINPTKLNKKEGSNGDS